VYFPRRTRAKGATSPTRSARPAPSIANLAKIDMSTNGSVDDRASPMLEQACRVPARAPHLGH
jgi:hypothetical protein